MGTPGGRFAGYLPIKDLGSGNFGVAKLMRHVETGELVAIKFIERGERVGLGTYQGYTHSFCTWTSLFTAQFYRRWTAMLNAK